MTPEQTVTALNAFHTLSEHSSKSVAYLQTNFIDSSLIHPNVREQMTVVKELLLMQDDLLRLLADNLMRTNDENEKMIAQLKEIRENS